MIDHDHQSDRVRVVTPWHHAHLRYGIHVAVKLINALNHLQECIGRINVLIICFANSRAQ